MAFQDFDQISERRRAERRRKLQRQIAIVAVSSIVLVIIVAAAVVVVVTKDQEDDDDGPNTSNNLNSVESPPTKDVEDKQKNPSTNPTTEEREAKPKTDEPDVNPKTPPAKEPEANPKTPPTKDSESDPKKSPANPTTKDSSPSENGGVKEKNDNKGDEKDTNDKEGKDKSKDKDNASEENKVKKNAPDNPATKDSSYNKNGGEKENSKNEGDVKDTNDKEGKDNENATKEDKGNPKNTPDSPATKDSSSNKNRGEKENNDNIQATKKSKANDNVSEDKKGEKDNNDNNQATTKNKANDNVSEDKKGEKEDNDNNQATKKNKADDNAKEDKKGEKEKNDNNQATKKNKANDNANGDKKGEKENNDNNQATKKYKANDRASEDKKGEKKNNDNNQTTKKHKVNDNTNKDKKGDDNNSANNDKGGNKKATNVKATHVKLAHHSRFVKAMCKNTDYQNRCQESLDKATEKNSSSVQPKDLLEAGIAAVKKEIKKAFKKTKYFKFKSEKDKAAFEDCKELLNDAIDELQDAAYEVGNSTDAMKVSAKVPELNNWLSAVMSYQQTCIDGFEDGKLKTRIKAAYNGSNELTSNSLALVSDFGSVLAELSSIYKALGIHDDEGGSRSKNGASSRHLLGNEAPSSSLRDTNGLPTWINQDQKRMLKGKKKKKLVPNVTVAKDGSGDFKTIRQALDKMPLKYQGRYIIYVKKGIYVENVKIYKRMVNVTMYGDGSRKSIISGSKNFADGVQTYRTATFAVTGDGFMAKSMGFRNTAGPEKQQAVAARVQADRAVFLNCRFDGFQDTLYVQTHRQFYRSCVVTGTIDFIFGDAAAIFQNCVILLRRPKDGQVNTVTAQGRVDRHETTGIVLQACRIRAAKSLKPVKKKVRSYLGRPWTDYARTVVMESVIDDVIEPEGWVSWEEEDHRNSKVYYAEYNNKGGGAGTEKRVRWQGYHKQISRDEASKFTVDSFLQPEWVAATGAPVRTGFFH